MNRPVWLWLAASSMLLAPGGTAATRPQYGGVLRVTMREAPESLDPADASQADSPARRNVLALIFETLVTVDDRGRTHAELAAEWQAAPGNQRWRFQMRPEVKFHDGSPLTADIAAASLRAANPSWKVFAEGDVVIVERDQPVADLPAELALTRNSIVKRNGGGKLSGTGPFHVEDWQPKNKLTLAAEENHWRGRPFVDAINVEMGRNFHDQWVELQLGKTDLVEFAANEERRAPVEQGRVSSSQPMELIALVFDSDAKTADDKQLRRILAHSVDRASMRSVLLQGAGQTTASILPNWMSGYGFAFADDADLTRARPQREPVRAAANWAVRYDANDSLARLLAERVALNAKDAGIGLRLTQAGPGLQLVRIPMASANPWVALANVAETLGVAMPKSNGDAVEDLYAAEQALLASQKVIPLFHLPEEWATSARVKGWRVGADGSWRLDELGLGKEMR